MVQRSNVQAAKPWSTTSTGASKHDHHPHDDIDDLLPSEYQEPWPPLSDEEIEERQRQAEWDDYYNSIPDAAERNRNLK